MKTLHLNLKKKWFDMILSGEKKEEYREIKQYWINRLLLLVWYNNQCPILPETCKEYDILSAYELSFIDFNTITFSNGYSKNRRQFEIEIKSISVGQGFVLWGADKNKQCFVFSLGKVIKTNFK